MQEKVQTLPQIKNAVVLQKQLSQIMLTSALKQLYLTDICLEMLPFFVALENSETDDSSSYYYNLYHYAGNNPVKYIDPDGNDVTQGELKQGNFKERSWFSKNVDEPVEKFLGRNLFGLSPSDSVKLMDGTIVPMSESGKQFAYSERVADCMFFCLTALCSVIKLAKATTVMSGREYNALLQSSIHNSGADEIMLGKYDGGGSTSYINKAGKNYEYFDMGSNWNAVKDKYGYSDADMFEKFNVPFLDEGIKKGKTFQFSHNPVNAKGALENEFNYLMQHGYEWVEKTMTAVPIE